MPYLNVETNVSLTAEECDVFLKEASAAVATALGKPEGYVMTAFHGNTPMTFGGKDSPCAFLEMKSIGLPENRTGDLSDVLCALAKKTLNVDPARIYIEFADAKRHMWGTNGTTF